MRWRIVADIVTLTQRLFLNAFGIDIRLMTVESSGQTRTDQDIAMKCAVIRIRYGSFGSG